jgi:hypothetical protein
LEVENQITIIRKIAEIEKLRQFWEKWQHYPNSDIDFFSSVIKSRKENVQPYVIVLGSIHEPIAIIIGRKETGFIDIKAGYKKLWRVKANIIVIMHNGFIGTLEPQTSQILLSTLKQRLRQGDADSVRFELLTRNSILLNSINDNFSILCREPLLEYRDHWNMALPQSLNDIFNRLSSNHRNQLRRISKKLERDFPNSALRIRCFQKPDELEILFNDVEKIAKLTYQRSLGAGFIDNFEIRSRLTLEASKRWLRMNVLYIDNEPSAYWWGIIYNNVYYSCALGYIPKYQNYSVGTYLLIKTIETLCGQNIAYIDFGPGDARYKQQLGDQKYEEASITLFAPTFKALTVNLILAINNALMYFLKKVLTHFKVTDALKKHWRRKLKSTEPAD